MRKLLAVFVLLFVLAVSGVQAGPKLAITNDCWIQPGILGQVHYLYDDDTETEDFYLRRGRLILSGQVMDGVQFFVETDNDNAGKKGAGNVSTDIQDAFIDVRLLKTEKGIPSEHWISGGLILLPFSFESKASAASLLGIDYNAEAIKLVNSFVWRDYGAELRGKFGSKFGYRIGVFDGYDAYSSGTITKNSDSDLRVDGHIAVNLIGDVENGWFFTQNRLGKSKYVTIGAGIDSQNKATLTTDTNTLTSVAKDSSAWVVDFQSGYNLGNIAVLLNGAYYQWDNATFEGMTGFVEGGVMYKKAMVTGKYTLSDPDSKDATEDYTAGLHYFVKDHNARAGIEYRWGDSDSQVLAGLQFLL